MPIIILIIMVLKLFNTFEMVNFKFSTIRKHHYYYYSVFHCTNYTNVKQICYNCTCKIK